MRTTQALHDALPRTPAGAFRHEGTEHQEQVALFRWLDSVGVIEPACRMAYAVPNGGDRHVQVGKRLKAEGVKRGIPDVHLPVRRGPYASLYVELKTGSYDTSDEQDAWLRMLHDAGNAVTVAYGWEMAAAAIVEYLTEPEDFVSGP